MRQVILVGNLGVLSLGLLLCQVAMPSTVTPLRPASYAPLYSQGVLLHAQGEFRESFTALERALGAAREEARLGDQGKCSLWLGILKWDLGDIGGSAAYFMQAASLFRREWNLRSQEFCEKCVDLVRLYNQARDDRRAKLYFLSALRFNHALVLARDLGILDFELKCVRQLALVRFELGELDSFLENSRSGLSMALSINHRLEQGSCLNNIGVYYQQRIDYTQAVTYLEQALAVLGSLNEPDAEADCLNNLGLVYRELGNFERAHHLLQEALRRDQAKADPMTVSMDLSNIGSVLLRKGLAEGNREDLTRSLDALQSSLRLPGDATPDPLVSFSALNNMGIVLNELKDYPEARRRLAAALEIAEREKDLIERSHALVNIAASYFGEMRTEAALGYFRSAYEIGRDHAFENVLVESCVGLGQCYERVGDIESALVFYMEAVETLESMKARLAEPLLVGFARNTFLPYERAVAIWADRYGRSPSDASCRSALNLIERAKARAFLESVRASRPDLSGTDLQRIRERQRAISVNIAGLSSKLAGPAISDAEKSDLEDEIEREEEESVRLNSMARGSGNSPVQAWGQATRSLEDIQRWLDDDEVLLEYFLSDPNSYLIRISRGDARLYRLPAQKELERSLRPYLRLLSDPAMDPRIGLPAARRIARALLPPDDDETFRRAKALLVAPDGILHYLPFETLRMPEPSDPQYLVESRSVSYCPSASALAILKARIRPPSWPKQMLAIGDPHYAATPSSLGPMSLTRLPFSRDEVRAVIRSLPDSTFDLMTGEGASEGKIKSLPLKNYRMIHFACHGFISDLSPLRSALALSTRTGTDNDGLLQVREIYSLDLSAELVVLSACQTGMGRLEKSEGPLAIARPFFFAGARAVIASLWSIRDRSTVPFMETFYRQLGQGRSTSGALREAKLHMLRSRWSHPFYWAGFLLQGDPAATGPASSSR